jgi:dolichol-phosphate mannosyltransferase
MVLHHEELAPSVTGGRTPWLSVIVPIYNEERTTDALLRRLQDGPYPDKEVIVVDDGSRDATPALLERWAGEPGFVVLRHPYNRGKGAAVRTGLSRARGEVAIIQDADLEYDPAEFPRLIEVIRRGESAVVYGSRYARPDGALPWSKYRLAVCLLNGLVRLLYGRRLTDEATCYKAFRTDLLPRLRLRAERFEFCAELTAKLCRLGVPIVEVPISYRPRSLQEGKKIGWRDAWQTAWTLLKWRCLRLEDALPGQAFGGHPHFTGPQGSLSSSGSNPEPALATGQGPSGIRPDTLS